MTQDSDALVVGDAYYNTLHKELFVLISTERDDYNNVAQFAVFGKNVKCQMISVCQNWLSHYQWAKNKSCVRL